MKEEQTHKHIFFTTIPFISVELPRCKVDINISLLVQCHSVIKWTSGVRQVSRPRYHYFPHSLSKMFYITPKRKPERAKSMYRQTANKVEKMYFRFAFTSSNAACSFPSRQKIQFSFFKKVADNFVCWNRYRSHLPKYRTVTSLSNHSLMSYMD